MSTTSVPAKAANGQPPLEVDGTRQKLLALGLAHAAEALACLLYTSPSPRDRQKSRMPSSA